MAFLSQPTYCYLNDSSKLSSLATELQVTDSQQNCECSSEIQQNTSVTYQSTTAHFESFSQPISIDNMILNSQIQITQNPNSQFSSQFSSQLATASQSPLLKLVKRLTRLFVHTNAENCTEELKKIFHKSMFDYKVTITNMRQRQITVITSDKRQTPLSFKVNLIEMNSKNEVLLDFRLSKGDGLEFKKIFIKIKNSLGHIACKRYVFINSNGCCDDRRNMH